jgi:hypothetical protein
MHTGVKIDDDNIDIVQAARQNLERLSRAADFPQTTPASFRNRCDDRVRTSVTVCHQENLSFHILMKAHSLAWRWSRIGIFHAQFATASRNRLIRGARC